MTPLRNVFGCDLRTLALVRVCLGFLVIADLSLRARTLTAHYTDHGVLPRAALLELFPQWGSSLHFVSGSTWVEALLFMIAGLFAIALILGYHARLAAFVGWILLISINARNSLISQGGDMLIRVLLLWCVFLPISARFSIDSALNKVKPDGNDYFSMATIALLVQAASVYFFAALLKSDPVWFPDGTAVHYALYNDTLVTSFGIWFRQFESLMQFLTYFVWILEIITPLLLFLPFLDYRLRFFGLFLLIAMHIGFFLNMHIGLFPFISITSLLAFLPSTTWDWLERRVRTPERTGIKLYFDGKCTFCQKVCLILRSFLLPPGVPIIPAQHDPEMHELMLKHDSWIVLDHTGTAHLRWQGVAYVIRQSVLFAPVGWLLGSFLFSSTGDRIYGMIARRRMSLGHWSNMLLPYRKLNMEISWGANIAIAFLLAAVIWTNLATLQWFPYEVPKDIRGITSTLRLSQKWSMFAPAPSKGTRWFVARGTLEDGKTVDVFMDRLGEPSGSQSDYLATNNSSYRWRKYLTQLASANRIEFRPYYTDYLCRDWVRHNGTELQTIELHMFVQWNHVGREQRTEHDLLWIGDCGTDPFIQVADLRAGRIPIKGSVNP